MKNLSRRSFITGVVSLMIIGMSGCGGRAGKEELASELHQASDGNVSSGSDADTDINTQIGGDEVKLEYTLMDDNGENKIVVDAVMDVSKTGSASIYEEKRNTATDASMDAFAGGIFDGGEYEALKPYMFCNEAELEMWKSQLESELGGYGVGEAPDGLLYDLEEVDRYMQYPQDLAGYIETEEERIIYEDEKWMTKAARLQGQIDEQKWVMNFWSSNREDGSEWRKYSLYPYDKMIDDVAIVPLADGEGEDSDMEEAKALADAFLAGIGYDNVDVIWHAQMRLKDDMEAKAGYYFVYGRSFNDVAQLYSDMERTMMQDGSGTAVQEYIRVCVDDEGVRQVTMNEVYDEQKISSENVLLMEPEKIDELARAEMMEHMDVFGGYSVTVTEVKFGYVTISYDSMNYSLVPAWIYCYTTGTSADNEALALFAVNALDGEIIELNRDMMAIGWY